MSGRAAAGTILPLIAGLLAAMVGCGPSRPARVPAPPVDPAGLTRAVLHLADADGDGLLTVAELARVPGLAADRLAPAAPPAAGADKPPGVASTGGDKRVLALDADGDNRLSAAEITRWLAGVRDSKVGITQVTVRVTHKGKPVGAAVVKLVPEPFMSATMKAAEGPADASGMASPSIPGSAYPGVNCGIYRAEITGSLPGGKPIPAKYNTATTLGLAVGNGLPAETPVTFALD
ncbi:MAG: hypothetical protein ACKOOF_05450 [Planctomycetaceae bacterium]